MAEKKRERETKKKEQRGGGGTKRGWGRGKKERTKMGGGNARSALRVQRARRACRERHYACTTPLPAHYAATLSLDNTDKWTQNKNTKLRLDKKYDRHTQPQKQTLLPIPRRYHYHNSNISAELHVCTPIIRVIGHTRKKATSGTHGHAGPQILA
jgi:hypothetical protein